MRWFECGQLAAGVLQRDLRARARVRQATPIDDVRVLRHRRKSQFIAGPRRVSDKRRMRMCFCMRVHTCLPFCVCVCVCWPLICGIQNASRMLLRATLNAIDRLFFMHTRSRLKSVILSTGDDDDDDEAKKYLSTCLDAVAALTHTQKHTQTRCFFQLCVFARRARYEKRTAADGKSRSLTSSTATRFRFKHHTTAHCTT